jgi:hypothetical protein
MTILFTTICLLALGIVFYGSLVPGRYRPRIGLDGHIEHALAYAFCGVALLPFLNTTTAILIAGAAMVALAAILELLQLWIPGRSCRLTHFLASAAGAIASSIAGLAIGLATA